MSEYINDDSSKTTTLFSFYKREMKYKKREAKYYGLLTIIVAICLSLIYFILFKSEKFLPTYLNDLIPNLVATLIAINATRLLSLYLDLDEEKKEAEQIKKLENLGLIDTHASFPIETFETYANRASSGQFLQIKTSFFASTNEPSKILKMIKQALINGATVQIQILHWNSDLIVTRSSELIEREVVPGLALTFYDEFFRLIHDEKDDMFIKHINSGTLEIHFYEGTCALIYRICHETAFVSFASRGSIASNSVTLEIKYSRNKYKSLFAEMIKKDFDTTWGNATTIIERNASKETIKMFRKAIEERQLALKNINF